MGHKGTCHLSFNPQNYRHGMVQTIHQTGEYNTYNILPVSSQCWLDRAEEIEIF
jgi:twinkle protein